MASGRTREQALRIGEYAKIAVRKGLHRANVDLVRNPYPARLATALEWLGVTAVLDVGANVGQYGSALRTCGFDGRIISCEPVVDAFESLRRRAGSDPRWTAVHTAVGAEPGQLPINVSQNSYSSSILPMTSTHLAAAPRSRFVDTQRVDIVTVADLVATHELVPATTMLKVDTQGYEARVLDGAAGALAHFAAVQLELSFVPLYEGQALFDALVARLRALRFEIFSLEPGISDPATGRLLQVDGLFTRVPSR